MPFRRPGLLPLLFLGPLLLSQEPWKDRQFSEWTIAEVQQVLSDSPWVRVIRFNKSEPLQRTRDPHSEQSENAAIARRLYQPLGSTPSIPAFAPDRPPEKGEIVIRWLSSRAMREGVARFWALQGMASPQATQALVAYETEQYAIGIGSVYVPANTPSEAKAALEKLVAGLKRSAYLRVDRGPKIPATAVEIPRGLSLTPAAAVIIYFPLMDKGKPLILSGAQKVHFHCELDRFTVGANNGATFRVVPVDVTFDLKTMIRNGRLDL